MDDEKLYNITITESELILIQTLLVIKFADLLRAPKHIDTPSRKRIKSLLSILESNKKLNEIHTQKELIIKGIDYGRK